MKSIEQAVELHRQIFQIAPDQRGLYQTIHTAKGAGGNQEAMSITFTSRVAKCGFSDDDPRQSSFFQGFYCVEINICAKWGGNHYDGTPRTETEVTVHVLDRLSGGMASKTWETNGAWRAEVLADDQVLPLLRKLLDIPEADASPDPVLKSDGWSLSDLLDS